MAAAPVADKPATRSLLRVGVEYALGSGLGLVGSILRVGISARILSAEERGLWLGMQLVFSYAQNLLHLGVVYGMLRAVPMYRARGDHAAAERAKQTSLRFVASMCGLGWVAMAVYLALGGMRHHPRYVLLTAVLTTVTLLRSHYMSATKAESRFRDVSVSATLGGATSILTIGLVWLAGLDGLVWGMTLQAALEMLWLARKDRNLDGRIDVDMLKSLLGVGILTTAVTLATVAASNVDRTVMLSRLGTEATGFYYIGANILILLPAVAGLPADVLLPKFFEAFGATGRGDSLVRLVEVPAHAGAIIYAAFLGAVMLLTPAIIALLWPNLTIGITAARVSVAAVFPVLMVGLVSKVFYAVNRQSLQLVLLATSAAMGYGAAMLAATLHPTIGSVAAGAAVGLLAQYILSTLLAYKLMLSRFAPALRLLAATFAPAVLAALLVVALETAGSRWWPQTSLLRATLEAAIFCLFFGPWALRAVGRLRTMTA